MEIKMFHQTDIANSKNWLNENIIFSYSSFMEPAINTFDMVNLPFIHKTISEEMKFSEGTQKGLTINLLSDLERELLAWDELSDEAFVIFEKSI